MVISSRTPEGDFNSCPICGKDDFTDPSTFPTRDAPCPHCGHLLRFSRPCSEKIPAWNPRPLSYEGFVIRTGKEILGPFPPELQCPLQLVIDLLARQQRLPERTELVPVILQAKSWQEVLQQLELRLVRKGRNSWARAAGAFVRRQFKRLMSKSKR